MKKISVGFILIIIFNILMIVFIVDQTIGINKLKLINPGRVRMASNPLILSKYLLTIVNISYFLTILLRIRKKSKVKKVFEDAEWEVNILEKLDEKELTIFKKMILANSSRMNAVSQLMIEKVRMTEDEFYSKLRHVLREYNRQKAITLF